MASYGRFALGILSALALTVAAVLLDLPLVRQVMGIVCFILLLGMVTLPVLKVKCKSGSELLVYSAGLGLVLLMVIGLAMNTLYPVIQKPLSTNPMLLALSVYMLAAIAGGFILKRESPIDFQPGEGQPWSMKSFLYTTAIVTLPAIAVLGTWALNQFGFNIVLMFMILAIAVLFFMTLIDPKVPDGVYTLLILSASVSLLLLYSLRSPYLLGFDIHGEYYTFSLTLANYHWSLSDYEHIYNTCLSITILPTVLYSLLNIAPEYIFKLVFQIAFALMPLAVYLFFKDKIDKRLAFLGAFFMMSHYMFYYQMPGLVRQEMALLLFVLAVYVLFTDRIKQPGGVALFLLFSLGVVLSHYSTSFLYLFILLATYVVVKYISAFRKDEEQRITAPLVLAVLAMILIWHGLVSRITLAAAISFGSSALNSVNNMILGVSDKQAPIASMILGNGIQTTLPSLMSFGIGTLLRIMVVLGVLYIVFITLFSKRSEDKRWAIFDTEYVIASFLLVSLVVISIIVPFVSMGYNPERLYMQSLVFLAPMCIVGVLALFRSINIETAVTAAGMLVVVFFLCQTGLLYQAFGMPQSVALNPTDSSGYLIYPQEVASVHWLTTNESPKYVYADNYGTLRLWSYGDIPRGYGFDKGAYVLSNDSYGYRYTRFDLLRSYVYLDYYNVNQGLISDGWGTSQTPVSNFKYLDRLDEVYDNGGSSVLKSAGRSL